MTARRPFLLIAAVAACLAGNTAACDGVSPVGANLDVDPPAMPLDTAGHLPPETDMG
jgi:hypothetical protein